MDSLHHVLVQDLTVRSIAGVAAGDVPVDIDVAFFRGLLGELGHDSLAVVRADGVGSTPGEAEDVCSAAGLFLYDILHFVEVCPISVSAGVDLAVFVSGSMNAHAVAGIVFLADQVLIVLVSRCDEESREDFVVIQYLKELFGVSAGPVVKSQIDDLLGIRCSRFCSLRGSSTTRRHLQWNRCPQRQPVLLRE